MLRLEVPSTIPHSWLEKYFVNTGKRGADSRAIEAVASVMVNNLRYVVGDEAES